MPDTLPPATPASVADGNQAIIDQMHAARQPLPDVTANCRAILEGNQDEAAVATVANANELARAFYREMGYVAHAGHRFDKATDTLQRLCWQFVRIAYGHPIGGDLAASLEHLAKAEAAKHG